MTSQYHYGIYSQNRAAERHILHNISELNIFGKNAQVWTFLSLLGEPKVLTYRDELLKSFR